jgi:hypothetical protein
MFRVIIDYDDKYCACNIKIPEEITKIRSNTKEECLDKLYQFFVYFCLKNRKNFQCDPPVFTEYYCRPYSDSMKNRTYKFDKLELYCVRVGYNTKDDFVVVDCGVIQRAGLVTSLIFRAIEE